MCHHLKKRRHLERCRHVPTSLILIIWTFFIWMLCTDMCKHLKRCRHLGMCRHVKVPTSVILIIWTFSFANWNVLACVSTWKSADTWKGADIPDTNHMDFFYLDADMYWHVSAPEKVPTPGNVPTRPGADIRHTNHMDYFNCKLGCAGMCQHLKKCRHLGRCRHV